MKTLDELKALWNAKADCLNQWDELGLDERVEFAQEVGRAECAREIAALPHLIQALNDIIEYYPNSLASDWAKAAIKKANGELNDYLSNTTN